MEKIMTDSNAFSRVSLIKKKQIANRKEALLCELGFKEYRENILKELAQQII